MRINKRAVEDLERTPKPAARSDHWDDRLAGFGLRRTPKGKITYVLKYRVAGDPRQRLETIGDWPAMHPDDAREDAGALRAAAAQGRDLAAEKQQRADAARVAALDASKRSIPLSELLDGFRTETQAELDRRIADGQVGSYEKELLRIEASLLRPAVGTKTIGEFSPKSFQVLLNQQKSRSTAGNLRALITRFTAYATVEMERRELPIDWPEGGYKVKGAIKQRYHRYTIEECARIYIAAGELGRRGALIRFMMLTAGRRSEAARVTRAVLKLRENSQPPFWLHIGGTTKNRREHRAPLSRPAVQLVNWLPGRSTRTTPDSELLFSGRGGKVVSSWSDVAAKLREMTGVTGGTFHDFRRTVVSVLADHGFDAVTTDKLLNHAASATMAGVMGTYQQSEMLKKRAEAVELWADLLFAAIDKALGAPVSRVTWGFDRPFEDAIVRRPVAKKVPDQRRRRGDGAAARSSSARSQASSASRV